MTDRKPAKLSKRYNGDGSITLYARGKKVDRFKGAYAARDAENFAQGWYGAHPVIWGRPRFSSNSRKRA